MGNIIIFSFVQANAYQAQNRRQQHTNDADKQQGE